MKISGTSRTTGLAIRHAAGVMLLALLGVCFAVWRSDERVLRRRLARLAALVEKTSTEAPLAALNRMRQVGDFFTADVEFIPGSGLPTTMGRQELLLFLQNARSSLHELRIRIREQTVTVAADRNFAETHTVVEISAKAASDRASEIREGILEWQRIDGYWRIWRLRAADTIRNPAFSGWINSGSSNEH